MAEEVSGGYAIDTGCRHFVSAKPLKRTPLSEEMKKLRDKLKIKHVYDPNTGRVYMHIEGLEK